MRFGRLGLLGKIVLPAALCLAVAVFAAQTTAGEAKPSGTGAPAALSGGNQAGPSVDTKESLGVRCGWILTRPGTPVEDREGTHLGPCSGHTHGGMTQGNYVPFR